MLCHYPRTPAVRDWPLRIRRFEMLAIRWGVVAGVAALALVGMVAGRWGGDGAGMPGGAGAGFKPAPNGSGS